MKIDTNEFGTTVLTSDYGKAIRRKGETTMSKTTSVSLAYNDSPDNWEDCAYGDPSDTRYSVRSVIRELKALDKFAAVRSLLTAANYDWEFVGSNYLTSDDPDFMRMCEAIVAQGIMTRAEIDEMLPKCLQE